jgi:glycosyltransferase involved in cell wall biosynthesis
MSEVIAGWGRTARLLEQRLSRRRALRWRHPPELTVGESGGPATVYYLCPDYPVPSGGIRVIYRHVDLLTAAGVPAAVLHHTDGFSCEWFEHSTRTVGAPSVRLSSADTLVVPEVYGPFLDQIPSGPLLVAFNQNAYLTFEHAPGAGPDLYRRFAAAMTVSEDSAEYLRFAFPGLRAEAVPNAVDPEVFHPVGEPPPRRLALMPRKRPEEAAEILRLLGGRLEGWEVVTIEGVSEREAAAELRAAPIFLALGRREGFGMPAAEAMASGCYVVGFPGFGGRDLFTGEWAHALEDGDVLATARELDRAFRSYEEDPAMVRAAGARAHDHVTEHFSLDRQRDAVLSFHRSLRAERP